MMSSNNSRTRQEGFVLWIPVCPLEAELKTRGLRVERLNGIILRERLTRDLGFSQESRDKNIEPVMFVAQWLVRNGVATLCPLFAPYRAAWAAVRRTVTNFVECHVEVSLEEVIGRDVKDLHKITPAGDIPNSTGVSDPYESPVKPEIGVNSATQTEEVSLQGILEALSKANFI